MKLRTILFVGLALLIQPNIGYGQLGRTWPYSAEYPYVLKGNVKTWKLIGEHGVLREQLYSPTGKLLKDEHVNPVGKSSSFSHLPPIRKTQLEKKLSEEEISSLKEHTLELNGRRQVLRKTIGNIDTLNLFDSEGRILMSTTYTTKTQTRAWNSVGHANPTYTFTDTLRSLTLFKYNDAGSLIDFEYYHSDPFKNRRVVYERDSSDNIIKRQSLDHLGISHMKDDDVVHILALAKDNSFDVNTYCKGYWNIGRRIPLTETYAYDSLNRKIEYVCHCLRTWNVPFPSFRATWEYDDKGRQLKERQYQRYEPNAEYKLNAILDYDHMENIIREVVIYGERKIVFNYEIEYY